MSLYNVELETRIKYESWCGQRQDTEIIKLVLKAKNHKKLLGVIEGIMGKAKSQHRRHDMLFNPLGCGSVEYNIEHIEKVK